MNTIFFRRTALILSFLLLAQGTQAQNKYTLSGYVKDAENGEELIGVTVRVDGTGKGVVTNPYGFYSITLPEGNYTVLFSYVGFETISQTVILDQDRELNVDLGASSTVIEEVVVVGDKEEDFNVKDVSMSRNDVDIKLMKRAPAFLGEPDILKTIQMLPGVISAGEGTSGYFVRGGGADQNLILIDEAPIYDPSHFFGLFSVFNADVIKDSELYKGGIPARFGGRLSSVLDVRTIDGNNKEFSGTGTVGLLASKIMLEGPLKKDEASFLLSGRRSYADLFLPLAPDEDVRNNQVYFYDLNAKVNWKPNNKDRFFVSAYSGRDVLGFDGLFGFDWGNTTVTTRWNHLFSDKLFSNTTLVVSNFDYALQSDQPASEFNWEAGLQEYSLKEDLTWFMNPRNTLSFGLHTTYRRFQPAIITPGSEESIFTEREFQNTYALDNAFYIGNEQEINSRISLQYGLRFSYFINLGEGTIYNYAENDQGLPDNVNIVRQDSTTYGSLEPIESFFNVEPRLGVRYQLTSNSSVKASYNRMVQYIHLLSNSTIPVPFNTWTPSSPYLDPQKADQVALGYFRNFRNNQYEFSAEVYYKEMQDVTDFADNANLLLNENVAVEYRQGTGTSYGLELFLQKTKGPLTGFMSYTLSKTELSVPGVNQNRPYLANYDRRHVFNTSMSYTLNQYWSLGANFTYTTGRPFTLPVGRYEFDGYNVDVYSGRNTYKLPDFHRLDLSVNLEPKKNEGRKWKSRWSFSVYNAYSRKNPFTIITQAVQNEDGEVVNPDDKEAVLIYLFPVLPSISYKITF